MISHTKQMARAIKLFAPLMLVPRRPSVLRHKRSEVRRKDLERALPWFAQGNVSALVVSRKRVGGRATEDLSLQFIVRRKLAKSKMTVTEAIPEVLRLESLEGNFITDVMESPRLPYPHVSPTIRPVTPGCSIGNVRGLEGTLGMIVSRNGVPQYLSCAHVLAPGGKSMSQIGDVIEQPGEAADPIMNSAVGTLTEFTDLNPGSSTIQTDAAIAACNQVPFAKEVPGIGSPSGILAFGASQFTDNTMGVERSGMGSGQQAGNIDGFGSVNISYPAIGMVLVNDLVLYTASSTEGDSGAAVFLKNTQTVVGIHVGAADDGRSMFTPIRNVFDELSVSLY